MRVLFFVGAVLLVAGCSGRPATSSRQVSGSRSGVAAAHTATRTTPTASAIRTIAGTRAAGPSKAGWRSSCQYAVSATRVGSTYIYEVAACNTGGYAFVRSRDDGATWHRLTMPSGLHDDAGVTVSFASRRVGFLLCALAGDRGPLYETRDGGHSWRRAPQPRASGLLAANGTVYAYDRHEIYVASRSESLHRLASGVGPTMVVVDGVLYDYDGIARYPEGGRSVVSIGNGRVTGRWRMPCTRLDFSAVLTGLPDGTLIAVCGSEAGTGTQIHRTHYSTDGDRDWRRSGALGSIGYIGLGASGSTGAFLGEGRGSLLVEHKPGGRWALTPVDSEDAGVTELGFWSSRLGWATTQGSPHGLWLTNDGGRHWRAAANP